TVHAGIACAKELVFGEIGKRIAGSMSVTQKQEFDSLLAIVQNELVVKDHDWDLERALGHIFSSGGTSASLSEFLGAHITEDSKTGCLGNDAAAGIRKDSVAVCMIAVVMSVQNITDRFIGGFLDGLDHVAGFFGKIGIDDRDVVIEDDPDVVAAAEG